MKWIIEWDAGYGAHCAEVEAADEEDACTQAYRSWKDEAEMLSDYQVIGESTPELREEYEL